MLVIIRSMPRRVAVASALLMIVTAVGLLTARPFAGVAKAGSDGDVVLGVDNQSAGATTGVTTSATYALHGVANGSGGAGMYGLGTSGASGVFGESSFPASGTAGVYGQNDGYGWGVVGNSNNGTGVWAESSAGTALQVSGTAVFSRSGIAVVKAGLAQVVVKNLVLTSASLVLATPQRLQAGVYVGAVVPNATTGKFTIMLNKVTTADLKVAWFIVN
jgi:hypothetical protein